MIGESVTRDRCEDTSSVSSFPKMRGMEGDDLTC
jgi:hypothetical protein